MKIVTFNVRCVFKEFDGINSFIHRAGMILDKITAEKPDVVAFQEITDPMVDFLKKHLTGYSLYGHGRNEDHYGEGTYTAICNDTVDLLGLDVFWMTDTPYKSSLLEGQNHCPRTCTNTLIREKSSGKLLSVYNVHLELKNVDCRKRQLEIVCDKLNAAQTQRKTPFVLLGDFNAKRSDTAVRYCETEFSPKIVDVTKDLDYTFHGFFKEGVTPVKTDYIYFDEQTAKTATNVKTWDDCENGIYLSDHYPICAEITL